MASTRARPAAAAALLLLLLPLLAPAAALPRARRQLPAADSLQPLESGTTWRAPGVPRGTAGSPSWSPSPRRSSTTPPRPPRPPRQATTPDDIPEFDRNKVSLDFPGNLFGPSVSLLIRTTKVIGDVIQNSAVRYQSFLRLFRPLFRGQFEIKGLDPPTTTTTTPRPADNEVRR